MKTANILIADDHHLVAESLEIMLKREPFINILGIVNNGWQALNFVEKNEVDLVIADLHMPLLNGIELAQKMKEVAPKTKIIILTMSEESQHIREALMLGAHGYVMKSAEKPELISAISSVAQGNKYFSERIINKLAEIPNTDNPFGKMEIEDVLQVTKREKEIIRLVAEDLSNIQIGERLHISSTTVETHRRNVMKKLGVNSAVGLVKWGLKMGIIEKI